VSSHADACWCAQIAVTLGSSCAVIAKIDVFDVISPSSRPSTTSSTIASAIVQS